MSAPLLSIRDVAVRFGGIVALDGVSVPALMQGPALVGSGFSVAGEDLFRLLVNVPPGNHLIDLTVPAGFQLYTFTFG